MKRKILSIFLTLVLLLSFGLATASPVAAQEELNVYGYGSELYVADGSADWAEINIPVDVALEDIDELEFREMIESYGLSGWSVNVLLGIDADGDDVFEADVEEWHVGANAWTLAALDGDTFVQMDGASGSPTKGVWTETDALSVAQWWTPDESGAGFAGSDEYPSTFYGSFADFIDVFIPSATQTSLIPDTEARVLCVKLLIGGSGSWMDETAYVDEATINGETYYLTIQRAVDSATGTVINVAAGTYEEDVTISADLTLEGAQVGVDARGRTGDESEIVGVVVVTSDAANVGIDGFTLTSPTREFTPRGFNLGVESESSTIRNNILVAEENAGHVPYGSYLTFQDITNALVEQNSFSGHLDLTQEPNVILFYGIAASGVVTVQNNEMHDCGGGGGVGIMCDNAGAVVSITGNEMDNTGDGVWVWYPGGSTFDTLSITSNDIHNSPKVGVKIVPSVTGDVVLSDNDFQDNNIQVDTGGVLDVEEVLANNTFDRAVVVDNPGSSLLPIIWSSIQDAVNAAVAGDTVGVIAGTYPENVVIPADKDGLQLIGAGSGVTSIEPASGKPVALGGNLGLIDGVRVEGFTLVTANAYAFIALSGTPNGTPYTTNLELEDIVVDGGIYGIGLNAVNGVTLTNVHLSNISGGGQGALEMTGVSNLLFTEGSIEDNAIGVRLQPTGPGDIGEGYGPNGNIQIQFTNFCGNGIAIENQDSGTVIDATNNYWCHPSGPHHNPGYGDPVSGDILFDPWLLEPFALGDPPPTFDKTLCLNIGWTLVSTDNWLDPAETVGLGVIAAINYTPSDGWFEVDPTDLVPVNALYLKTEEGGALGINYSGGVPVASSKDLEAGWNLISSATIDDARNILSPLRYIDVGEEQGVGLATLVSQGPPLNHNSPSFYLATLGPNDWNDVLAQTELNPFDGYWVYMNDGKSFGVVPGAQP